MSDYPEDIDYSLMKEKRKLRSPIKGVIEICPICGVKGLERTYSWRRGRYQRSWWHTGTRLSKELVVAGRICSLSVKTLAEVTKAYRNTPNPRA